MTTYHNHTITKIHDNLYWATVCGIQCTADTLQNIKELIDDNTITLVRG